MILRIFDVFVIAVAYCIAKVIVNETSSIKNIINTILLAVVVYSFILHMCRTYKNITRYENGNDYLIYVFACFLSYSIVTTFGIVFPYYFAPLRITSVAALIIVTTIIGYRVLLRFILNEKMPSKETENTQKKNV